MSCTWRSAPQRSMKTGSSVCLSAPAINGAIFAGLGRSHSTTAETSRESPRCRGRGKNSTAVSKFHCVCVRLLLGIIPALLWLCYCPASLIRALRVVSLGSPANSNPSTWPRATGVKPQGSIQDARATVCTCIAADARLGAGGYSLVVAGVASQKSVVLACASRGGS